MPSDNAVIIGKLDDLSRDISHITRRLRSFDEFKQDFSLFANDAFSSLIHFLGEVDDHFDSRDLLALIQKSLRNLRGISSMLNQLQSIRDLIEDASPMLKEAFSQLVARLDKLEKDGVLRNLHAITEALTRMLSELSGEDILRLADALTTSGKAASRMASRENLEWLDRFSHAAARPLVTEKRPPSLLRIILKSRHPRIRRQLHHILDAAIRASGNESTKKNIRRTE